MVLLKLRSLLVFCILALLLCTQSALAQAPPIKIVVFGDSLTSGYQLDNNSNFPAMLERKLKSDGYNVKVLNQSISGETSSGGVKRLNDLLLELPDIALVELGINDAMRGIDVNNTISPNLSTIIGALKQRNVGVLVCGVKGPLNMKKSYNQMFEAMYYALASSHKTSYLQNILKGVAGRAELTLADGLHPNEKGTLQMVQNVYPTVLALVKWRIKYLGYQSHAE